MKKVYIILSLFISLNTLAQTEVTVVTQTENKTITETSVTDQKKLKSDFLKKMVSETAEKSVDLYWGWEEGGSYFSGINNGNKDNYNINNMKIINGEVTFMEVEVHGFYMVSPDEDKFSFYCRVDLEKYDGETEFLSEYAYCETDHGEEIEYENLSLIHI